MAACCLALMVSVPAGRAQSVGQQDTDDTIAALLQRLELALLSGNPDDYLDLTGPAADRRQAERFATANVSSGVTRAVVRERDRAPLTGAPPGDGFRLLVEVFIENADRARIATWRLDVRRRGAGAADEALNTWAVIGQESLSTLHGLHRLSLDVNHQYALRDVTVAAEDLQLAVRRGTAFVATTAIGPTAVVLLGDGNLTFSPAPAGERNQVRIFTGAESLRTGFDAAFLRVNPSEVTTFITGSMTEQVPDPRELQKAQSLFREHVGKSFGLDLTDLSRDVWSLIPSGRDFLAEIRTRRFDTLTYAKSNSEPEDVTLFDRKRRRNISIYSSKEKLAQQGRFYGEDDLADYDILEYDVDAALAVTRFWIEGRTHLRLVTRKPSMSTLTLRLAEPLAVRSVWSDRFGRLLSVRVRNQNSVVVNFPDFVDKGTELTLTIGYGGRIEPQPIDRELIGVDRAAGPQELEFVPIEDSYLYSNRSYWYPQGQVTDYATATMRISVPPNFSVVASGQMVSNAADAGVPMPGSLGGSRSPQQPPRVFLFRAGEPVRYLSVLVTRLANSASADVEAAAPLFGGADGPADDVGFSTLALRVEANPRQTGRGRALASRAEDILRYYSSLAGAFPYPSMTVALVERELPGGHSPPYMTVLNQQIPTGQLVVRDDPAMFDDYPDFFIAHELAHQWWGQAVGWKNYHEQWLSEALSQYFATLYAERARDPDVYARILRQLRAWAIRGSDEGAVYLGYRVGHIKGNSRMFRAVVYNKGAAVLHMLRRLMGDEAFFRGLQRFYRTWRFRKAGSEDLRAAMEAEAGIPLSRFFERWIYNSALPKARFSWRANTGGTDDEAVVRIEQEGDIFDFPVTVTVSYQDGSQVDTLVKVTDRVVEQRIPLKGRPLRIDANRDETTVLEWER